VILLDNGQSSKYPQRREIKCRKTAVACSPLFLSGCHLSIKALKLRLRHSRSRARVKSNSWSTSAIKSLATSAAVSARGGWDGVAPCGVRSDSLSPRGAGMGPGGVPVLVPHSGALPAASGGAGLLRFLGPELPVGRGGTAIPFGCGAVEPPPEGLALCLRVADVDSASAPTPSPDSRCGNSGGRSPKPRDDSGLFGTAPAALELLPELGGEGAGRSCPAADGAATYTAPLLGGIDRARLEPFALFEGALGLASRRLEKSAPSIADIARKKRRVFSSTELYGRSADTCGGSSKPSMEFSLSFASSYSIHASRASMTARAFADKGF